MFAWAFFRNTFCLGVSFRCYSIQAIHPGRPAAHPGIYIFFVERQPRKNSWRMVLWKRSHIPLVWGCRAAVAVLRMVTG